MSIQYLRKAIVTIGFDKGKEAIRIENLRMSFNVEATRSGYPNTTKIVILNLNPDNRKKIKDKGAKIQLEAGYSDDLGIIFRGDITKVYHEKQGSVDVATTIEAGDGQTDFQESVVNESLPAESSSPKDLVTALAKSFKDTGVGNISALNGIPGSSRAVILNGTTKDELDKICRKHNLSWSIQNGLLEITKNDSAIEDVVILSSSTGLLGIPAVTDSGVNVKSLLNPRIRPNRVIRVISDYIDNLDSGEFSKKDTEAGAGFFRVDKVVYSGDTEQGEFICDIKDAQRLYNGSTVRS